MTIPRELKGQAPKAHPREPKGAWRCLDSPPSQRRRRRLD